MCTRRQDLSPDVLDVCKWLEIRTSSTARWRSKRYFARMRQHSIAHSRQAAMSRHEHCQFNGNTPAEWNDIRGIQASQDCTRWCSTSSASALHKQRAAHLWVTQIPTTSHMCYVRQYPTYMLCGASWWHWMVEAASCRWKHTDDSHVFPLMSWAGDRDDALWSLRREGVVFNIYNCIAPSRVEEAPHPISDPRSGNINTQEYIRCMTFVGAVELRSCLLHGDTHGFCSNPDPG